MMMPPLEHVDTSLDDVSLAELLLDHTDRAMKVFIVQCGGDKVGYMPKTARRSIHGAMGYCLVTWGISPAWQEPGYWRKELDDGSGVVIEIYELSLEP